MVYVPQNGSTRRAVAVPSEVKLVTRTLSEAEAREIEDKKMENQEFNNTSQYGGSFSNPPHSHTAPMKPKNWMTEAILITILPLCCLCNVLSLLGIVSIVYANQVNRLYFAGRYGEAEQASKDAKMWFLITLGLVLLTTILSIIVMTATEFGTIFWENFMEEFRRGLEDARR